MCGGDELFDHYRHTLEALGNQKGLLGLIFNKSQNKLTRAVHGPRPSAAQRAPKFAPGEFVRTRPNCGWLIVGLVF